MSKKLFVGGLSWGTTDDGLHGAFSQFGEIVEAKVITDRETGRSRGFGFVTFANDEGATKAIAEMDGTELDGRTIKVNEAEDKPARSGGGGGGRGGYGGGTRRTRRRRRRTWRTRRRRRWRPTRRVVIAPVGDTLSPQSFACAGLAGKPCLPVRGCFAPRPKEAV